MKEIIHNKIELKDKRKFLRNHMTSAEAKLWKYLRNKSLDGRKFRRQHSVGVYILDSYCPSEKLCVELDGEKHYSDAGFEHDQTRTKFLKEFGIKVCRVENERVFKNIEGVLQEIMDNFITTLTARCSFGLDAAKDGRVMPPSPS